MATNLPPNAGKGRKPGVPNKITKTVREAFQHVFHVLQTEDTPEARAASLEQWAKKNPAAFYQLAARLIPTEISVSGSLSQRLLEAREVTKK